EVSGGQEVLLQIRFAEVSRTATTALGVNFAVSDGNFNFGSNTNSPGAFQPGAGVGGVTQGLPRSADIFAGGTRGSTSFEVFIQALRENNLRRWLAEPNLVAISGQEADFLAGGDFPVPIVQGGNDQGTSITVEFREFGVKLNFLPVVLGDGRVRL